MQTGNSRNAVAVETIRSGQQAQSLLQALRPWRLINVCHYLTRAGRLIDAVMRMPSTPLENAKNTEYRRRKVLVNTVVVRTVLKLLLSRTRMLC